MSSTARSSWDEADVAIIGMAGRFPGAWTPDDVGGHSLLAVQMAGALAQVARRTVPLTDVFRFPTIRALAGHVAGNAADGDGASVRAADARASARRAALGRRQG